MVCYCPGSKDAWARTLNTITTWEDRTSVSCQPTPPLTALPTVEGWGAHSVGDVTGELDLRGQEISVVPAGGFDACPYTAATQLRLGGNAITAVGARAFANLAALRHLTLNQNAIRKPSVIYLKIFIKNRIFNYECV